MSYQETRARRTALVAFGLMLVIFIVLSGMSFIGSRKQALPQDVSFAGQGAIQGKRVFQAYDCMGCHTMLGNGAYFAPDLTKIYTTAGPAWLSAFLPSPGSWPTAVAVAAQLQNSAISADAGATTLDAYYARYPGAKERVERRGGMHSFMPSLRFRPDEIPALIAFLKYSSEMNTEGWPPTPDVNGLNNARAARGDLAAASTSAMTTAATTTAAAGAAASAPVTVADSIAAGAKAAQQLGCTACHAATTQKIIGPGWGGLFGSTVKLTTGATVVANEAYIEESISDPDAKIVAGFTPHIMPNFGSLVTPAQRAVIVAYIRSLGSR